MHSWIYAAWGVSNAHNSFDSVPLFKMILEVIIALSNGAADEDVNILAASANAYWFEHYNHIIKQDQYEKKLRAAGKAPPAGHKIWTALKQRFPKLFSLLKKILKRF